MKEEIRKLIDDLYKASNEAGMTLEEIQKEIAMRFEKKEVPKAEFKEKTEKFVEMLYHARFCRGRNKDFWIKRTVDVLCIYHELSNPTLQDLMKECSKKWGISEGGAYTSLNGVKKEILGWMKKYSQSPVVLYNDLPMGKGKEAEYIFNFAEKHILNM